MVGEEVAFAILGPRELSGCQPEAIDECLDAWKSSLPQIQAGGVLIRYPWDLVEANAAQITRDFRTCPSYPSARPADGACSRCDFLRVCGADEERRTRRKPTALYADLDALRRMP